MTRPLSGVLRQGAWFKRTAAIGGAVLVVVLVGSACGKGSVAHHSAGTNTTHPAIPPTAIVPSTGPPSAPIGSAAAVACSGCSVYDHPPYSFPQVTTGACGIAGTTKVTDTDRSEESPGSWPYVDDKEVWSAPYPDPETDVYQLMIANVGPSGQQVDPRGLSADNPAAPPEDRYKVGPPRIRPEGDWILVAVEDPDGPVVTSQSNPSLHAIRNNAYYTNLWVTNISGTRWYKLTDFTAPPGESPGAFGVQNAQWSPNGDQIVFSEPYRAPDPSHEQGYRDFYVAGFSVNRSGVPRLTEMTKIDYPGDVFYETQAWSPDGTHVLVQTVFPWDNAYAPNIASVDVQRGPDFGRYIDLTNSDDSWNEHAVFSPDGSKIAWISSYAYPDTIAQYGTLPYIQYQSYMRNDVFLMDSDGKNVQELTWFNDPSSPEHTAQYADAVYPTWNLAGTELMVENGETVPALVEIPGGNSTWLIHFNGVCG